MLENPGEWFDIDNGALKVKGFINGNVHILITEEICNNLNLVLAWRIPNNIPKFRDGKRNQTGKVNQRSHALHSKVISFPVCTALAELTRDNRNACEQYREGPYTFIIPLSLSYHSDCAKKEMAYIYRALGATEVINSNFWPLEAFKYLALNGEMPDHKTHQFYPSGGELQRRAVDECELSAGMRLLEPSIGFGGLLKGLPDGVAVTGIEINRTAAQIIGERWPTLQAYFLQVPTKQFEPFDRILMTPPYSEGRWKQHIKHAR
ncbi:hypothetical protein [Photorhabdus luminescens]|uniref:hypothetical protein n=1 Tax=Photorhabdus luminescens TaxID=29488 RepID=UPI00104CB729|nr:hypothetical protein [Photorhabdus luminescens]